MKQFIPSLILGFIGGLGGALIFEPIEGVLDILFSDFTIGGIIVGVIVGYIGLRQSANSKIILYSMGIGLIVFGVFGLLSGQLFDDLVAGGFIGLLVGLANRFLGNKVDEMVDNATDHQV